MRSERAAAGKVQRDIDANFTGVVHDAERGSRTVVCEIVVGVSRIDDELCRLVEPVGLIVEDGVGLFDRREISRHQRFCRLGRAIETAAPWREAETDGLDIDRVFPVRTRGRRLRSALHDLNGTERYAVTRLDHGALDMRRADPEQSVHVVVISGHDEGRKRTEDEVVVLSASRRLAVFGVDCEGDS